MLKMVDEGRFTPPFTPSGYDYLLGEGFEPIFTGNCNIEFPIYSDIRVTDILS